jgi:hypothetical protein
VENLEVTPDFLRQLAQKQDSAAATISEATAAAAGLAGKVKLSHGVVCAGAWPGITSAESERQRAITALAQVSRQLAQRLLIGLDDYMTTEDKSGAVMDKQVQP